MTEILSPQLVLRPFEEDDITDRYLGWLNDRHLMRYSRQRFLNHTRESCEEYWQSFVDTPSFFWNVALRQDQFQIGTITAYIAPMSTSADIGILMGYPGYGKEAWGAALAYLFEYQGVWKITAGTMSTNKAMKRIADHWKMTHKGTRIDKVEGNKFYHYSILRSEWTPDQILIRTTENHSSRE